MSVLVCSRNAAGRRRRNGGRRGRGGCGQRLLDDLLLMGVLFAVHALLEQERRLIDDLVDLSLLLLQNGGAAVEMILLMSGRDQLRFDGRRRFDGLRTSALAGVLGAVGRWVDVCLLSVKISTFQTAREKAFLCSARSGEYLRKLAVTHTT